MKLKNISRHSEQSEESISHSLLTVKDSSVTSFSQNDGKKAAFALAEAVTQVGIPNKFRKAAFTLAEVLVTLGIIGVVSAMTVPSLMQNYQRQSYVTQLHKFYNELQQALITFTTEKNALNAKEAGMNSQEMASNFVKTYFKTVQDCGADKYPCFAESYKKMSGLALEINALNQNSFILASGQAVGICYFSEYVVFRLDINGQKGPNIQGRDFFELFLFPNGVIDDYPVTTNLPLTKEERESDFQGGCVGGTSTNFHGCFGKILNDNWQMTY